MILAIGLWGNPNRFNVPGDSLDHVGNRLVDPAGHPGEHVVIVGAGDSAIENGTELAGAAISRSRGR